MSPPAQPLGLRPRRKLARPMVLTPLVDIVFLLLTFFMLSSQLTPFSLISLSAGEQTAAFPTRTTAGEALPRPEALLSVAAGQVRLNGRAVETDGLLAALRKEAAAGTTRLTILASADASVQDFVAALEAAKLAAFPSIAVADMR